MTNTAETTKNATAAHQGGGVAPETASSKKGASQKKVAPEGQRNAKGAKPKASAPKASAAKNAKAGAKAPKAERPAKSDIPRPASKGAKLLAMIARPQGATLSELMQELGWQAHSVRGFISTAGKKTTIESTKNDAGERVYKATR